MTKNEFMTELTSELNKRKISDTADILEEYEQHFSFKLADGYTEEEIAAKLGNPAILAAQFGGTEKKTPSFALAWLWLIDLFFGIFAILLMAFGAVLAACVISFGLTGICLTGNFTELPFVTLPTMPYQCSLILGISLIALCALSVAGCIWYFAFCRQIFRAYGRFHQNTLAPCRGSAVLPALPIVPQFKKKRYLRTFALAALLVFAITFVLGFAACVISAGSFEFWHTWGWFV